MFQLKTHCCEEIIVSGNTLEHALKLAKQDSISLAYANLTAYWLMQTDFSNMDLRGTDFSGSVFYGSNFQDADLTGAIVDSTTFHRCDMRGVNRTGVIFDTGALDGADIEGMYSDLDADRQEDPWRGAIAALAESIRSQLYSCREVPPTPYDASVDRARDAFLSYQSYLNDLNMSVGNH